MCDFDIQSYHKKKPTRKKAKYFIIMQGRYNAKL